MICLDTMVLIWGVQKTAKSTQVHMVDLTERFLSQLGPKETVMVPAVALAEYLTGFPDSARRKEQYSIIERRFFVPAFDPECAELAAELASTPEAQQMMADGDRRCLKVDLQVIATAIVHGAESIITSNVKEYTKLAKKRIKIQDVPVTHIQTPLDLLGTAN